MKKPQINYFLLAAVLLVGFGVAMRLLPHDPNITPTIALGLVAGAYLGKHYGYLVPLAIMFISDLFIGTYDWRIMASVYLSFALIGIGGWLVKRYRTIKNYLFFAFGGSALFFLLTNGAVWLFSPWYTKDLGGLLYAYELGLPFWRNMLVGDMLYTTLLMGVAEAVLYLSVFRNKQHTSLSRVSSQR